MNALRQRLQKIFANDRSRKKLASNPTLIQDPETGKLWEPVGRQAMNLMAIDLKMGLPAWGGFPLPVIPQRFADHPEGYEAWLREKQEPKRDPIVDPLLEIIKEVEEEKEAEKRDLSWYIGFIWRVADPYTQRATVGQVNPIVVGIPRGGTIEDVEECISSKKAQKELWHDEIVTEPIQVSRVRRDLPGTGIAKKRKAIRLSGDDGSYSTIYLEDASWNDRSIALTEAQNYTDDWNAKLHARGGARYVQITQAQWSDLGISISCPEQQIGITEEPISEEPPQEIRDLQPGATWRKHPNGGGWVSDTATVEDSVYVSEDSAVYEKAVVRHQVKLIGTVRVYGFAAVLEDVQLSDRVQVFGSAKVSDRATISGRVQIKDSAEVYDTAVIGNSVEVGQEAKIYGNASLNDSVRVYGNAEVFDKGTLWGNVEVLGYAKVYGNAVLEGSVKIHGNGQVYDRVRMAGKAQVYGNAQVFQEARVRNNALIYDDAKVFEQAKIDGWAKIFGEARVQGNAMVYEQAQIFDTARVSDDARVRQNARIYGNARIRDGAIVKGDAIVYGDAQVFEFAKVDFGAVVAGNARVHGDAKIQGSAVIEGSADISTGTISSGVHT